MRDVSWGMDIRGEWAYTEGQGRDNKRHVERGRSSAGSYAAAGGAAHGMDREGRACGGKNEQGTGRVRVSIQARHATLGPVNDGPRAWEAWETQ